MTIIQTIGVTTANSEEMGATRRKSRSPTALQLKTSRYAAVTRICKFNYLNLLLDYLSTLHNSRCNSSVVVQVSALSLVLSILAVLYNGLWQNNLYNLEILQQTINFHYLATQPADQHQPPGQCPGNKLIADPTPRPSRQPHTTMLWLIISELFIPWWSECVYRIICSVFCR